MAKELPYFQFEPAEYLTKDISFCSLSAQGLFINLCSYYWQRQCELTKTQFLKRLNHDKEFNELLDEGVFKLTGDKISISFLDIQFTSIEEEKAKSSTKGKIGNLKRWNRTIYDKFISKELTLKEALELAKVSPPDKSAITKTSQIREEEIKRDEIREDKIIKKESLLDSDFIEAEIYPTFIDFWDLYDKKKGKKESVEKKWSALKQSVKEKIIEYIPNYILSQPNKKYRKDPMTFLNNNSWEDELIFDITPIKEPVIAGRQTAATIQQNLNPDGWGDF